MIVSLAPRDDVTTTSLSIKPTPTVFFTTTITFAVCTPSARRTTGYALTVDQYGETTPGTGVGIGETVGDGDGETEGLGEGETEGLGEGETLGDGLGETLGDGEGDGEGETEGLGEGDGETEGLTEGVGETLGEGETEGLGEGVGSTACDTAGTTNAKSNTSIASDFKVFVFIFYSNY